MHVEAHDLVKTYPPGVRALDGMSTTIKILTTRARPDGPGGPVTLVVASVLLGTVFSALSNVLGISTAFMAKNLMPGWMRAVAAANPVNWALDAARSVALVPGAWLLALAALMVWLSTLTFRSHQRTV